MTNVSDKRYVLGKDRDMLGYATIQLHEGCNTYLEYYGIIHISNLHSDCKLSTDLDMDAEPWMLFLYIDSYWDKHIFAYNHKELRGVAVYGGHMSFDREAIHGSFKQKFEEALPKMLEMNGV
jgi:hypothetical protein